MPLKQLLKDYGGGSGKRNAKKRSGSHFFELEAEVDSEEEEDEEEGEDGQNLIQFILCELLLIFEIYLIIRIIHHHLLSEFTVSVLRNICVQNW